jgi:hypothetical protein
MTIRKLAVRGAMLLAFAVSAGGGSMLLATTNGNLHIGSMLHGDPDDGGQSAFLADPDPPTIRR